MMMIMMMLITMMTMIVLLMTIMFVRMSSSLTLAATHCMMIQLHPVVLLTATLLNLVSIPVIFKLAEI